MGESGKPDIDYTFADHARYLDAWFDALDLQDVVLVGHDWGGALAFDWAARHPDRVRGIAFIETIVKPMAWEEFPEGGRELFRAIKTPGVGETMILDDNVFIEQALPGTVATALSPGDLDVYREPYPTRESRLPLLQWARSMPLGGEPADVVARVEAYDRWLAASADVPKLLLTFAPGAGAMMHEEHHRLVRGEYRRPGDRTLRGRRRAPHTRGPARADRSGHLGMGGQARPSPLVKRDPRGATERNRTPGPAARNLLGWSALVFRGIPSALPAPFQSRAHTGGRAVQDRAHRLRGEVVIEGESPEDHA